MQDDDTANPACSGFSKGETLWNRKIGGGGRACADCHGDARTSMKGVAARYPAFDAAQGRGRSIWSSASTAAAPSGSRRRRSPGRAATCSR